MKTISRREIKVKANQSKRTFTIVTDSGKYRTLPMKYEEFNVAENNTGNDWQNFLRTSQNYYKIR